MRERPGRSRSRGRRGTGVGWLYVLPNAVLFGGLLVVPIVFGVGLSFFSWNLLGDAEFVGLENFRRLFSEDQALGSFAATGIIMVGAVLPTVVLGFLLANALNARLPAQRLIRFVYVSPILVSTVAAAVLWRYVFAPDGGLDYVLTGVGLPGPDWFGDPNAARAAVIAVSVWKNLPLAILFYLAALQNIPAELRESAALDGAGAWRQLWDITWPGVRPTTVVVVVTTLVGVSFGSFDVVSVLTSGGPLDATNVLPYYAYTAAFRDLEFGYASALSSTLSFFILAISVTVLVRQQRLDRHV